MSIEMNRRSSALLATVLLGVSALVGAACSLGPKKHDPGTRGRQQQESAPPTSEMPETAQTKPTSKGDAVDVVEVGFSTYQFFADDTLLATAGAVVENTGETDAVFFEVIFSFKDGDGKPVGTQTDYVNALEAGGTGYAVVDYVELTADAVVVEAAASVDEDPWMDGQVIPVVVEGVTRDDFDDSYVNGTATNDTDEVIEFAEVSCVLRTDGEIVGGASGVLDTLVPGSAISWSAMGAVPADDAECSASA